MRDSKDSGSELGIDVLNVGCCTLSQTSTPRNQRAVRRTSDSRPGINLWAMVASIPCLVLSAFAVELDESKLPAPATLKVDFARDIKPLLASHCLKCHSDEKPKSNFRLTNRDAALKGGEHGVDIVPGQSAKSPLIFYVARLDEEMAMPPEGRGTPLTPGQVALLRAWLDQGVVWESLVPESKVQGSIAPTVGWTTVSGDEKKFRELYWQPNGWNGGLEQFEVIDKPTPDSRVSVAGHVLVDDYKLTLSAEKNDLGFSRFGWTQFRKYYDDTGGYFPSFTPASIDLNRDLHLDVGRAFTDFGLTLPNWPRLVFGYEFQYRDGTEATLQWGPVTQGTEVKAIFPSFKELSEKVHILKFDADYDVSGWQFTDSFRGEWYRLGTREVNEVTYTNGTASAASLSAADNQTYFQGANTFHLEKQFKDWLFGSGGYLYSKLTSDASFGVEALNPAVLNPGSLVPAFGWSANDIELERESHVFSISALVGPWEGLSLSIGSQNEWTRQTGFGDVSSYIFQPVFPYSFGIDTNILTSSLDRRTFSQNVGLRFTKIPFSTLFAEARLQRNDIGQYEEDLNALTPFLQNTEATSRLRDFRTGFNTSPWRQVSISAQYRRYENDTDYDHLLKEFPGSGLPYEGYPAFITRRELLSNQAEAKLAVQWTAWLKTSLTYQWLGNEYHTRTEAATAADPLSGVLVTVSPTGELLAGTYNAHIASLNATLTPWRRLFLTATFAYQNARTVSWANGFWANGTTSVQPYAGDIYSVIVSGNYTLNPKTDLVATYAFSTADFAQDNYATGLPLGINYHQHTLQAGVRRHITKQTSVGLQYRFYLYDEPSGGGANNFEAHGIFATLVCRLP